MVTLRYMTDCTYHHHYARQCPCPPYGNAEGNAACAHFPDTREDSPSIARSSERSSNPSFRDYSEEDKDDDIPPPLLTLGTYLLRDYNVPDKVSPILIAVRKLGKGSRIMADSLSIVRCIVPEYIALNLESLSYYPTS
jgi:hypothetical protein